MAEAEELQSIEEFLFGAPLYRKYRLPADLELTKAIYGRSNLPSALGGGVRVDGHCPKCHKLTTYTINPVYLGQPADWGKIETRHAFDTFSITCARDIQHVVRFWFQIAKLTVQKVGQWPSLADISNDEVREFRSSMNAVDGHELHKAIGLAAHGAGIGSFVYLRRVFERLITGRFEQFREQEGWNDDAFTKMRMAEKVKLLKGHLPGFLIENAEIYSILSRGVHELDEDTCLGAFDFLKESIIVILQEDKKKKEELAQKKKLQEAIKRFSPQAGAPEDANVSEN